MESEFAELRIEVIDGQSLILLAIAVYATYDTRTNAFRTVNTS